MKRYRYFTGLLLGVGTLFHLWYISAGIIDLAPDEAHYWEWSRRLDWSYYSKGPIVAYLIAASTRVGGSTEFFVRLPAVVLSLGAGVLMFLLGKAIFHTERAGFFAVVICSAIPLFVAGSMLMTIDAPLVFFWTVALYGLRKAMDAAETENGGTEKSLGWWVVVGLAIGLGFLSKYTMLLFFLSLAIYLLLSPERHRLLHRRGPYWALLISVLLSVPVLVWNAKHEWVSVRHVLGQAGIIGSGPTLSVRWFAEFLASQIGVVSPLLFFALAAAVFRSGYAALRGENDRHAFLVAFSLPPLAFFLLWSVASKVQANWAAPAYLGAALALAGWWDEALVRAQKSAITARITYLLIILVLLPGVVVSGVAHFPDAVSLLGIHLPVKLDPTRRLQGWKELGAAVGEMLEGQEIPVIFMSDSYQIASEIAFYAPGQPTVYNVNLGRRMNQYDIWGGLESMRGENALFVSAGDGEIPGAMRERCGVMRKVKVVETFYRGDLAQVFSIFVCGSYKGADLRNTPALY